MENGVVNKGMDRVVRSCEDVIEKRREGEMTENSGTPELMWVGREGYREGIIKTGRDSLPSEEAGKPMR